MEAGQVDQYYTKIIELVEHNKDEKTSKVEVILGNIKGKVEAKFFRCKNKISYSNGDTLDKCKVPSEKIDDISSLKSQFEEIIPKSKDLKEETSRYWFEINWKDLSENSKADHEEIVLQMITVVRNVDSDSKISSYEIQMKNKDRIYLLKEAEYVTDRVLIEEKRHYKFQITSSDVE